MGNTNNKRRRQTATGATTALHTQPTTDFKQRSITTDWLDSSERSSKQMRTCRKPALSLSVSCSHAYALSQCRSLTSVWTDVCLVVRVCVRERQSSIVCNLRMDCVRRRQRHVHQYMCIVCAYNVIGWNSLPIVVVVCTSDKTQTPTLPKLLRYTHIYRWLCVCVDIMLIVLN